MKFGVLVFPGSNCERDAAYAATNATGAEAVMLWHAAEDLQNVDAIIVPGGFSYGDYLRTGALARFAPIMKSVARFAADGGPVLGICNGFQILCEAGLLPGALVRNTGRRYICRPQHIAPSTRNSIFTAQCGDKPLRMPIGHAEGQYLCDDATLRTLEETDRIAFRYCDEDGVVSPDANPNGSRANIAGILNEGRNVLGMMPHPDRSAEGLLGSHDGALIFKSMAATAAAVVSTSTAAE